MIRKEKLKRKINIAIFTLFPGLLLISNSYLNYYLNHLIIMENNHTADVFVGINSILFPIIICLFICYEIHHYHKTEINYITSIIYFIVIFIPIILSTLEININISLYNWLWNIVIGNAPLSGCLIGFFGYQIFLYLKENKNHD